MISCSMIIIVAHDANRTIGLNGDLPWRIPSDLKHFQNVTKGNAVIMGGTTWKSLGRPLKDRLNIVVSKTIEPIEGIEVYGDIESAIKRAEDFTRENGREDYFVIGGASIYEQLIDRANKIILTQVWGEYEGDVFFPKINLAQWTGRVFGDMDNVKDGDYHYTVFEYERC